MAAVLYRDVSLWNGIVGIVVADSRTFRSAATRDGGRIVFDSGWMADVRRRRAAHALDVVRAGERGVQVGRRAAGLVAGGFARSQGQGERERYE